MIMPLPTLLSMLHLKVSYPSSLKSALVIGYLWFLGITSDMTIMSGFTECSSLVQSSVNLFGRLTTLIT